MPLKPLDFCIAIPALAIVIASFFLVYTHSDGRGMVNLKAEGGEWVFPLDTVETMSVSGPLGDTLIEIRENNARVVSSPCTNQTCVAAGTIHSPGQWTACLPNRVMVYVSEGKSEDDVDAAVW